MIVRLLSKHQPRMKAKILLDSETKHVAPQKIILFKALSGSRRFAKRAGSWRILSR